MDGLALIAILAVGIERLQEFLIGKKITGWPMQATAWVVGIGVCLLLQFGMFRELGMLRSADLVRAYGDYVITGLAIGLGSNFIHDIFSGLSAANTPKT